MEDCCHSCCNLRGQGVCIKKLQSQWYWVKQKVRTVRWKVNYWRKTYPRTFRVYVILKVVYDPTMQFLGFRGCSVSLKTVDIIESRLKSSFIWGIKWYDVRVKDEVFIPISLRNCVDMILLSLCVHLFVSGMEEDWKQECDLLLHSAENVMWNFVSKNSV